MKRFDVFSLGWKQVERQILRYLDDEEVLRQKGNQETQKATSNVINYRNPFYFMS